MFLYSALFWTQLHGLLRVQYEIRFGPRVRIVSQPSQRTGIIRQAFVFASEPKSRLNAHMGLKHVAIASSWKPLDLGAACEQASVCKRHASTGKPVWSGHALGVLERKRSSVDLGSHGIFSSLGKNNGNKTLSSTGTALGEYGLGLKLRGNGL